VQDGVLKYLRRDYLPGLGFVQRDPSETHDANLYRVDHNDPINQVDPLGLRDTTPQDENRLIPSVPYSPISYVSPKDIQGASWRLIWILEVGGKYRELYVQEAADLKNLNGQIPQAEIDRLRGELKAKYQRITPPEVEQALRTSVGNKYDKRTPTGKSNPAKTNEIINTAGKVAKNTGRVFLVYTLYSEYEKIHNADDWNRQLGSSASGFIGSIAGGELASGVALWGVRFLTVNPYVKVGTVVISGLVGGGASYQLFSGGFEELYDVIYENK
jgi:hypothetical protein